MEGERRPAHGCRLSASRLFFLSRLRCLLFRDSGWLVHLPVCRSRTILAPPIDPPPSMSLCSMLAFRMPVGKRLSPKVPHNGGEMLSS